MNWNRDGGELTSLKFDELDPKRSYSSTSQDQHCRNFWSGFGCLLLWIWGMSPSCLAISLYKGRYTYVLPVFRGRSAVELEDFEDLIDLAITTEQRFLFDQLSKNTTNCPYIHPQTILPLPQQYLRSSIPQGLNLMGECLDGQSKSAGKSKISNFQYA